MTLVSLATTTALAALSTFNLPTECDVPTYAIYKPRGVLSRTGTDNRRTLTDLMVTAGLKPLSKHVGRLDFETGGLILVTADALLLEAALSMPGAISLRCPPPPAGPEENLNAAGTEIPFQPLAKTYELLLAGRYCWNTWRTYNRT